MTRDQEPANPGEEEVGNGGTENQDPGLRGIGNLQQNPEQRGDGVQHQGPLQDGGELELENQQIYISPKRKTLAQDSQS